MADSPTKKRTIVHYSADLWEHVCPVQRVVEPAQHAGFEIIHGNEWIQLTEEPEIFPERVKDADLVIIQRDFPRHFEAYDEIMTRARALYKPVLYEWDDMLTELPREHPDYDHYMSVRAAILAAIVEADLVTCATPYLAEYTRQFNPNVLVLPNYLNDRLWKLRPVMVDIHEPRPVTIGYMGAHSHEPDLAMVAPVLESLLDDYGERLRLQLWNINPPESLVQKLNLEKPWPGLVNYASFVDFFLQQTCDIVIAPLLDSMFNRGKSWQKFLEYSALGIPGVFSHITPYEMVVKHGQNGFLAQSLTEWESYLRMLIEDAPLRLRMGQAAQQTVREDWMLSGLLQSWKDAFTRGISLPAEAQKSISPIARKFYAWDREALARIEKERNKYYRMLEEKDKTNLVMSQTIAKYENSVHELNQRVAETDLAIQGLNQRVAKADQTIHELDQRVAEADQTIHELDQRVAEADQTIHELHKQLDEKDRDTQILRQEIDTKDVLIQGIKGDLHETSKALNAITNSTGWKLLEVVYRFRLFVAPRGSTREHLLHTVIKSAHALKTTGLGGFLRKASSSLRSRPAPVIAPPAPVLLTFEVTSGKPCPKPAISLVIVEGHPLLDTSPETVQDWAHQQTTDSYEIILWKRSSRIARALDISSREWQAGNSIELCQGLAGRYVCLASDDLLQQSRTYLEENLFALEGENLAFTVNLMGQANWALKHLHQGVLPGNEDQPLARMIVHVDCIGQKFLIDLSSWVDKQKYTPVVAGKVLWHTSSLIDQEEDFPMAIYLTGIETRLEGKYILSRIPSDQPWQSVTHILCAPDEQVLGRIRPVDQPTILTIFPFLAVGGAEQLALHIISSLKNRVRFVVFTTEEMDVSLGTLSDAFRQETPWVYNLRDFLHSALDYTLLINLIKRCDPDCLYIANGSPWIYDVLPDIKKRYPDLRTVNQVYDSKVGWINRYDLSLLLALDGHIGANNKICQAYINKGAKPDQVYLVEHGIDPKGLDPENFTKDEKSIVRKKLGLPHDKKIVTFASRIHPQKRPMDFVELARRFSDDESVIFLMVGDGPLVSILDEQVKKIGLKNFYHHGFYRPIGDILAISDVVVLPSEYEGMPMIIAEAQLMGKPVVVTDVGNNREVLEITGGGEVIDQIGNIEALERGVRKMLTSSPNAMKMRQAYLASFGIDVIAQKYFDALLGKSDV